MKISIIGGGITGLTAAYRLSQNSHQVTVFEKNNYAGGLAAGFKKKNWNWHLENFFHHLFTSDQTAKNLISELGLSSKLFYRRPKTSIFKNGFSSQFDSPFSLLTFPHLSLSEKIRVGLTTGYLKSVNNWKKFEKVTAKDWLKKNYGKKSFQILWQPLLEGKFATNADQITMSWFWARIKKRSAKLGYLEGGFQVLIDKLVEKIEKNGGKIHLNSEWKNVGQHFHQPDRLIFTVPASIFLKIMNERLPVNDRERLQKLKMIGALNLILPLKEKFLIDDTYWLNINESDFPFIALVEHTNFIDSKHYGGNHLLYVGGYYRQNHPYFKMKKEEILKEFLPYLKKINPNFNHFSINQSVKLKKNLFAQPIISTNHLKIIPEIKTPLANVYLANMEMIYPWDRGINYAIRLGEKVAHEVSQS